MKTGENNATDKHLVSENEKGIEAFVYDIRVFTMHSSVAKLANGPESEAMLRRGLSAYSIDMSRERRPRPTSSARIGTADTKNEQETVSRECREVHLT